MGVLRIHRLVFLICTVLLIAPTIFSVFTTEANAESRSVREYRIKAAFLYNFARFTEWPADKFRDENAPMILCVMGVDPFGPILENTVLSKKIKGRSIIVERTATIDNLRACHVLFVSSSEWNDLPEIIESLSGAAVLTTGDMDRFAKRGGIIKLTTKGNKIRFEINPKAAERAGVKLSSYLLNLATIITEDNHNNRRQLIYAPIREDK